LGTFVLKVILASAAMTVAMVATTGVTQRFVETWVTAGSIATAAFQLLFGALVGVAVYGLVALVLRIKEVTRVIHFFKHRFSFGSADSIP
jgi:hypothetical protein